jgi:hypothetical protein
MCRWNQTQFKIQVQRFLNLKKCDRTRTKGFKFWKNWLKPVLQELSHKFLNVRIGLEVLSKRKNRTTPVYTQCWQFPKVRWELARFLGQFSPKKLVGTTNNDTQNENWHASSHCAENWPYENCPWYLNVKKNETLLGSRIYWILVFNNRGFTLALRYTVVGNAY